jgi:hypothetical protein
MRECLPYLLNRIYRLDGGEYRPIDYLRNQIVIDCLDAFAVTLRQRASKGAAPGRYPIVSVHLSPFRLAPIPNRGNEPQRGLLAVKPIGRGSWCGLALILGQL